MAASELRARSQGEDSGVQAGQTALILDIQRMSTEDGPGLRTTVFFKGCNLACPWCHNPESISFKADLNWFENKCLGCNICLKACPQKGIGRNDKGLRFNRALCAACGTCVNECPNAAIELKGRKVPVEKLAGELIKDKAYFGAQGGITLSGGEVMAQQKAALALAKLLKERGLHIALDTAGYYDFSLLEEMLSFIDLVLYDIKIFDSELHKKFTGAGNSLILENYVKLAESTEDFWVRTPIIEGASDSGENIEEIARFIAAQKKLPQRWELCAFNNLGKDKYERLDLEYAYKETALTKKEHIEKLTETAKRYVPCASFTGALRREE